jgi:hypothetical protein
VLLSALATRATAQAPDPHAVQPERPTVATHAHTVATGWMEIESGIESDRLADGSHAFGTPTELKLGVASHLQLNVNATWVRLAAAGATVSGAGDAAVGLKWRLLDGAPVLGDFAVLPSVKFPAGSATDGTGTGTTDGSLLLISSHAFGPVSMDLNVGATWRSGDGAAAPRTATLWTASFGGPFAGPLGWVAECFGYPGTAGPAGTGPTVALLGGPTVLPRPWLAFDAGVILPVSGGPPRAVYAGGVVNLGRLF